ncbi:MAG: hypothetical protein MjAS7_1968 [Metallosphaera javensis (ex Sakai et al. 2022)]|nr:MAG: hypothetical protein MjAS7_1968 [Metallosphaera javensis (ex Sakai et al. 2022)]
MKTRLGHVRRGDTPGTGKYDESLVTSRRFLSLLEQWHKLLQEDSRNAGTEHGAPLMLNWFLAFLHVQGY